MKSEQKNNQALTVTIKKMVPAVLIAMISTGLGLLSLYRSKVPMINDFGAMLTIGIVIAFMIAIFVFIPFLYIRDKHFPKEIVIKARTVKPNTVVASMVTFILKIKYVIIGFAVLLAVAGLIIDQNATAETNLENFMPQDSQALEDIRTLRSTIGSTEQIAVVLKGDNLFDIESLTDIKEINMLLMQSFSDVVIESQSLIH
ncbi:MAG TPA: hypothetical protein VJY66_02025, partial [Acholeplasma sp.]|nr:hypothetical protein [Acholeplasma sp.]